MKLIKGSDISFSELLFQFDSEKSRRGEYLPPWNPFCRLVARRKSLYYVCFRKINDFILSECSSDFGWSYQENFVTTLCNLEIYRGFPQSFAAAVLERKVGDVIEGIEFLSEEKIYSGQTDDNRTVFILTTKWLHLNDL